MTRHNLLELVDDLLCPTLEQQLAWCARDIPPEPAGRVNAQVTMDRYGLGAVGNALGSYKRLMLEQLDSSQALIARLAAERDVGESQTAKLQQALAMGQAQMDRDIARLASQQRYQQVYEQDHSANVLHDYAQLANHQGVAAKPPERKTDYVTSQGRYISATPKFPDVLPR